MTIFDIFSDHKVDYLASVGTKLENTVFIYNCKYFTSSLYSGNNCVNYVFNVIIIVQPSLNLTLNHLFL